MSSTDNSRTRVLNEDRDPAVYTFTKVRSEDWDQTSNDWVPNGNQYSPTILTGYRGRTDAVMTDVVTPQFLSRQRKGEVINNPLYRTIATTDVKPVGVTHAWRITLSGTNKYRDLDMLVCPIDMMPWSGDRTGINMPDVPELLLERSDNLTIDVVHFQDLAIQRAAAEVSAASVNINETLGEAKETYGELVNIWQDGAFVARKILNTINRLRGNAGRIKKSKTLSAKEKRRKLKRLGGQIREQYLRLRYGLRPMYHDIVNLTKAFNEVGNRARSTYRGFASTEETWQTSFDTGSLGTSTPTAYGYRAAGTIEGNTLLRVRAGYCIEWETPTTTLAKAIGLTDSVGAAWELTPGSFIIDKFIDIGEFLAAHKPIYNGKVVGSWVTTTISHDAIRVPETITYLRRDDDQRFAYELDSFWVDTSNNRGRDQWSFTTKSRTLDPEIPVIPSIDINVDYWFLLDLVALVFQPLKALTSRY